MKDALGYAGQQVVVTGAASGMGEAAAALLVELGAEVFALDVKSVKVGVAQSIRSDLADVGSIDAAIGRLPPRIDALFSCAGLPGPPFSNLDTMLVNFVGLRHLTESLLRRIPDGGAVAHITSVAGMGWRKNLDAVKALVATADFAAGRAWCEANPDKANGYLFSKQCIIYYTKKRAGELVGRRIRMNCLSPAPTATPMLPTFHEQAGKQNIDTHFQAPIGRDATSEEMAEPLVFLNSRMARFVSGQNLFVDFAYEAQIDAGMRPALL
jgi:NAD(P)-dependent dehydrogenase (short-subunit alcohol dehydrogenase family)